MNTQFASQAISAQRLSRHRQFTPYLTTAIVVLGLTVSATAQDLLPSAPSLPLVAPVMRPVSPDAATSATNSQSFDTPAPITLGELKLHTHLATSYLHASGLPLASGASGDSEVFTVAPGITGDLGQHWTGAYTATAVRYSNRSLDKSLGHNLRITGANSSTFLGLQLAEAYSTSNSILLETAQQTKQSRWSHSLSATHPFGNLFAYNGSVGMTDTDTSTYGSTRNWTTNHGVSAPLSSRLNAGLSLGLGYAEIPENPNTRFESYNTTLGWRPTDKINLTFSAGWQHQHLLSTVELDKWYPILDATLTWSPFEQTNISISDDRSVSTSLSGDATTDSHSMGISLNQRLFNVLNLNLSYNLSSSNFQSQTGSLATYRSDDVKSFRSSLSVNLYKYWSLAMNYQSSKNQSSQSAFQYRSSQYGLSLSVNY